jgi:oxygen-independent coproporphyrinogen III oxidase
MIKAIIKEIQLTETLQVTKAAGINTIYFGGGTPSILHEAELRSIVEALQKRFVFAADAEITLEANPDDITASKLQEWRNLGINRLSVGIQSFQDDELIWMNRAHNAQQSLSCIDLISEAGFTNYSVDLIYGSPLLDDAAWKKNVDLVIEKNIPHLSCYALTVEPKTALDNMIRKGKARAVDADKQARQFLLLMEWLKNAGYEHYEISNFAKPGKRSRHNSSYWRAEPYYGFGPGAHAYDGTKRKWNIANNSLYIQSIEKDTLPYEEELLTPTQQLNEYIMISLRTMEGISLSLIHTNFGKEKATALAEHAKKYIASGKLIEVDEHLVLTDTGKLFADGIAADLFF